MTKTPDTTPHTLSITEVLAFEENRGSTVRYKLTPAQEIERRNKHIQAIGILAEETRLRDEEKYGIGLGLSPTELLRGNPGEVVTVTPKGLTIVQSNSS